MKKVAAFLFISIIGSAQLDAQNEFDRYGPYGSKVYTDLKEALKATGKVYKMDLSYQQVDAASYQRLPNLGDLQALKLRANGLNAYPVNFDQLKNLFYFGSFDNELPSFPPNLRNLQNLTFLELYGARLDSIPAHIAYLNRLSGLRVGNTGDTLCLPNSLKYLRMLRDLVIENCVLDSLPSAVFEAPGLEFLQLVNTNTHYLPTDFQKLQKLEVLVIENNSLTRIPFGIYKAQKLRVISLRANKLSDLPPSIAQLESLSLLDLRGNNFSAEKIEELRALLPGCEIRF